MAGHNRVAAIDADSNFPPDVRQKISDSAELKATYLAIRGTAPTDAERASGVFAYIDNTGATLAFKVWDSTSSTWITPGASTGPVIPDNAYVTETGDYLVTETGDYLVAA